MSTEYNVIQDLLGPAFDPETADSINYLSFASSCVIAVIPFLNPATYSRFKGTSGSKLAQDAVDTAETVVITTDILNCTVQQSKNSYVGALNATLTNSDIPYLTKIFPNDWLFCWIVYSDELRDDLVDRIKSGQPCNKFSDGLKFVGRVSSFRKAFVQNPGGPKQVAYTLQGNSFKEFDSTIFYDPFFQQSVPGVFDYMARLSVGVDKLFDPSSASGASITTYTAFTTFIDLIIGSGIPKDAFSPGEPLAIPQTQVPTLPSEGGAAFAYCVPTTVGNLLNKTSRSKSGGVLAYADILELLIGVQNYSKQLNGSMTDQVAGSAFAPDNVPDNQNTQLRYTNSPLLGNFDPISPQFANLTLWTILSQYLNPAVNEMYTTLRVNPAGYIEPTLVVRQFPFTSELLSNNESPIFDANGTFDLQTAVFQPARPNNVPTGPILQTAPVPGQKTQTRFQEVPRWHIPNVMVNSGDLGRTDALHFNFVHIYGEAGQKFSGGAAEVAARIENPPKTDDLDIKRSGIRMYPMQTVNCSGLDVLNHAATRWMELVADFAMDQHLTLNGTINSVGIQSPIAPGDNVLYDGTVLHIEEVAHQWSVTGGTRRFVTTLSVTHGVRADPQEILSKNTQSTFPDRFLYEGVESDDLTTNDPGITHVDFTGNEE